MTNEIEDAYRYCAEVSRGSASNFLWSFRLLSREQRRAMCVLYAYARQTDDLADSELSAEVRRIQLEAWRSELDDALSGNCRSPLWTAVHDVSLRFAIPGEYFVAILDGVAMDLSPPNYDTFSELRNYCYHVASAVGLACIHIFGFEDERAKQLAVTCGLAFQLTNILRDLREDAVRGRVYLPREELMQFDCQPDDLLECETSHQVRELLRFQIARAEQLYDAAAPLAALLNPQGRRAFIVMFATYRTLLAEIKRRDGDVFSRRVRLGYRGKLRALVAAMRFRSPKPELTNLETFEPRPARHKPSSRSSIARQPGR
ncbi:MAG: phytoene/squalene synthase family protein [Planctomycetaceae bacterium]|nr:phytoene/squalene synthase family protein [Planctomycetales bacterium]MCB9920749.1 phytoene/squalene synthase family protein [Planctomycetaceae bacterium]